MWTAQLGWGQYRAIAVKLRHLAQRAQSDSIRAELATIADAFDKLAAQVATRQYALDED